MQVQIQHLSSTHDLKSFDCGSQPLNEWLAAMANQQEKRHLAKTFVCVNPAVPKSPIGFYTLAVSEISNEILPSAIKLPRKVPVIRLGRFAVAAQWQGYGLGKMLLLNALERVAQIAENAGLAMVVVDAKDDKAAAFYAKYGFIPSPDNSLLLFMPMQTLLKAISAE